MVLGIQISNGGIGRFTMMFLGWVGLGWLLLDPYTDLKTMTVRV